MEQFYQKLLFKKKESPLVSIIIPVHNFWELTYSCLQSIEKNTKHIDFEIIIADDVSVDETRNIHQYAEHITVIRSDEQKGFLRNCNYASSFAKGQYILFLNNDTIVQKDWLKYLLELIESDESIAMVGSKLVYPDGKLQEAGGIIWRDASGWNYGWSDDPNKPDYNYVKEVDYVSGACCLIRANLWRDIGGFDERFVPAYYEDTDLAFEVRKRGYKVMYQPKSTIVHLEGMSNGKDVNTGIKKNQIINQSKFYEKWRGTLKLDHFENGQNVFWARDRSRNRKTILVIDHYVPHYDKDAGSRNTFHYLKLFKEMGLNVIFLGDNFYPHQPYTSQLEKLGIQVLVGNWYAANIEQWIKEHSHYINYVYLNRPHISIKYIDLIKKNTSAKVIYFGHDLHYLREKRNYEVERDKAFLHSSKKWKKLEFELFNKADSIYVVSRYEKKVLSKSLPDKKIRTIPLYLYNETNAKKEEIPEFAIRQGLLFVGGFGHKPNSDGIMWFVDRIFPLVKDQIPNVRLYIVGSNPPTAIKDLQSDNIIVTGDVSDKELDNYYKSCRVVIVPLRFGAGVKGKVVEALYHQVPIVTTSIGAEGLKSMKSYAALADNEKEFAAKVCKLYENKEKWERFSKKARSYIEKYFSPQSAIKKISKDIRV